MITFGQFFVILGGIGFLLFGILAIKIPLKKRIFPILIGLFLLYLNLFGPLSKGDNKIETLINLDSKEIEIIHIMPTETRGYEDISLLSKSVSISDTIVIEKICRYINKSKDTWFPNIKPPYDWACRLEIELNGQTIPLGIRLKNGTTIIEVKSDGEYGWNYGELHSNGLGELMEKIIKTMPNNKYNACRRFIFTENDLVNLKICKP